MASRDKASPEGLRKDLMSAVVVLDLVVEWFESFDIGFGDCDGCERLDLDTTCVWNLAVLYTSLL
jgi:hypothetical protein